MSFKEDDHEILLYFNFYILLVDILRQLSFEFFKDPRDIEGTNVFTHENDQITQRL